MTLPDDATGTKKDSSPSSNGNGTNAEPDLEQQPPPPSQAAGTNGHAGHPTPTHERRPSRMDAPPQLLDTRFGGIAANVEVSVRNSIDKMLGSFSAPFAVTGAQLGELASERTRTALADILKKGVHSVKAKAS